MGGQAAGGWRLTIYDNIIQIVVRMDVGTDVGTVVRIYSRPTEVRTAVRTDDLTGLRAIVRLVLLGTAKVLEQGHHGRTPASAIAKDSQMQLGHKPRSLSFYRKINVRSICWPRPSWGPSRSP